MDIDLISNVAKLCKNVYKDIYFENIMKCIDNDNITWYYLVDILSIWDANK